MGIRDLVLDELKVLSQPRLQLEYEESLTTAGHAPTELVSVFCDDLFDPKSAEFNSGFSRDEHKALAHLYGLLVETPGSSYPTVGDMLKDPKWRRVVAVAQQLTGEIGGGR